MQVASGSTLCEREEVERGLSLPADLFRPVAEIRADSARFHRAVEPRIPDCNAGFRGAGRHRRVLPDDYTQDIAVRQKIPLEAKANAIAGTRHRRTAHLRTDFRQAPAPLFSGQTETAAAMTTELACAD